ncbi:hypothetical protein [Microcystis phage Mwe-Yong1]|nr:hypothetical protein [Microcystis phage Mwe-Yong1]
MRLLGGLLLIIGLVLTVTIVLAPIGIWFMLFGVLLLIFGGSRRVEVHYHDDTERYDRRERRQKQKPAPQIEALPIARRIRDDAADDFPAAVLLYQKHVGCREPGDAIRMLATEALRQQGFLK